MAKAAIRLPIEGQKRRKLLVLVAAYADAGECRPSDKLLSGRLPFTRRAVVPILKVLEAEGWLRRSKRNNFVLLFDEHGNRHDPTQAVKT